MPFFRRRKPLHERLADAGGIPMGTTGPPTGASAEPPGWDGEPRGEPGIHGVPRPRRWDAVVQATAPGLRGDSVNVDALAPLATVVEQALRPRYRAEAVRHDAETWAVGASRIAIATVTDVIGDHAELTSTREGKVLRVDGITRLGSVRALEKVGEAEGTEYVVRATRLDGDLWEVDASPL